MNCIKCGKEITGKKYGELCQGCYKYFKDGGKIYPIPPSGIIQKDDRGYVICHICGKSYKRLGSHIRESHQMTIEEYKEIYGLCRRRKTTEAGYSAIMRNYAIKYKMDEQLAIAGVNTRIKQGEKDMRKGKPVRLQEIIDKQTRKVRNSQ